MKIKEICNRIINFFYKLIIETKIGSLKTDLDDVISIMEKYNLIDNPKDTKPSNECFYYKRDLENGAVYDFFVKNLHIHISNDKKEIVYSVRLKKNNEEWQLSKDKETNSIDASHPKNQTFEIFIWYDVPVLDITRVYGYVYKHGMWDKHFYQTVIAWIENIKRCTDISSFNENYK